MATISTGNLTTLVDNIAKVVADLTTSIVTNPTSNAPTVATITAGLNGASNSTQARLAALADFGQELALQSYANSSIAAAIAYMTGVTAVNSIYAQFIDICNGLDLHVNGLNAFLVTNSLQVHPAFANAFNYFAANAVPLGKRGSATVPTAVAATQVFPATVTTPMGTIAVTGGATGTFTAGSSISTASYGAVPLYIYNNSSGVPAAATVLQVTYTGADGASHTVNKTISTSQATGIGAGVTLTVSGTAVTNITVTSNGTNAESYIVYAPVARTITY